MEELFRRKNVATVLRGIPIIASTDHVTYKSSATLATGDIAVRIDDGSYTNIGTLPTEVGSTGTYDFTLTAGELNGDQIVILGRDAAGGEWDDFEIRVNTKFGEYQAKSAAREVGKSTHNRETGTVNDYDPDNAASLVNSFTTSLDGDTETRTPA